MADIVSTNPPSVEIELFSCRECGSSPDKGGFYRPLSSLEGQVRVVSARKIKLTSAQVYFQGLQTSIVPTIDDAAVRVRLSRSALEFLNVEQDIPITEAEESQNEEGHTVSSFKFFFIIPAALEQDGHKRTATPAFCCTLPPTLEVTNPCVHWSEPISVVQASIRYTVSAAISYMDEEVLASDAQTKLMVAKDLTFVPYTEEGPPTSVTDFPGEYVTRAAEVLKSGFFGRPYGVLQIDINEPSALKYVSATWKPATACSLGISIVASRAHGMRLQPLTVTIKTKLRTKTFSSLEPLRCMPTEELLSSSRTMCLNEHVSNLGKHTFHNLNWVSTSDAQAPSLDPLSKIAELSGATDLANWKSNIKIPITPPERLLPNFCSVLISRSYSVLLKVIVTGPVRTKMDLEVPLQVVHEDHMMPRDFSRHSDNSTQCVGVDTLLRREEVSRPST